MIGRRVTQIDDDGETPRYGTIIAECDDDFVVVRWDQPERPGTVYHDRTMDEYANIAAVLGNVEAVDELTPLLDNSRVNA